MNHKLLFGLAATLTLAGCGGGSSSFTTTHTDTPSVAISASNALAIAADVYQVAAVDAPFTAALAMDPSDPNAINSAACTDPNAISGGTGMMNGSGMDMMFNNCTLSSSPSTHTLTVDGSCSNVDGSSTGIEVVSGEMIRFRSTGATQGTQQNKTLDLHNFTITRSNDNMTSATGFLHRNDGGTVKFSTQTAFAGTAMTPTAGSLIIVGAANSRLRLSIVNGGTGFTLEVDADGDGIYDAPQPPVEQNWNNTFWLTQIP